MPFPASGHRPLRLFSCPLYVERDAPSETMKHWFAFAPCSGRVLSSRTPIERSPVARSCSSDKAFGLSLLGRNTCLSQQLVQSIMLCRRVETAPYQGRTCGILRHMCFGATSRSLNMNALWERVSWAHRPYIEVDTTTLASASTGAWSFRNVRPRTCVE